MDHQPQEHRSSESSLCGLRRETVVALAICGFLLLAVAVVFSPTLRHGFLNFDDNTYVNKNPHVAKGLTAEGVVWAFTAHHAGNWHPLTWLSHMLDCQLYGLQPAGHHLTNVLLHAAAAALLFLVLWRMTGACWPAAFAAAVFAIHPLRVESVAWVAERKDVLCGLFFMLTLGAYWGYAQHAFSRARYGLVLVLFALGLMAKPMLVSLPLVLLLLDYWPLERVSRQSWRGLVVEKLPLLAMAAACGVVTIFAQDKAVASVELLPISTRLANASVSGVAYLGQFFCPLGLAAFYPHPENTLPIWKVVGSTLLLGGLTVTALLGRRRFPYWFVGWFWYLVMLAPVSGLAQAGEQAMADRFTYLPQIGLGIALAWGARQLTHSWPCRRWVCNAAAALAIVTLAGCAWQQTSYWHDDETLWNRALDCTTGNAWAHYNLGVALMERGRTDEALGHFQEAVNIQPRSADALNNIGIVLAERGRLDEAVAHFRRAIQCHPDCADAHDNLANALKLQGKIAEAVNHWQQVVRLQPNNLGAVNRLAWASATAPEASVRNGAEALELARWAVLLSRGREPKILRTLAAAYAENGQFPQAVQTAHHALDLATHQKQRPLAESLKAQLACYESGKPFRELPGPTIDAARAHP
jgi:tetratricopeptide (TPR) repeat protein